MNVSNSLNDNDEVIFKIKDIMNNQYDYKVDIKYKDEKYCEIIGFAEIEK